MAIKERFYSVLDRLFKQSGYDRALTTERGFRGYEDTRLRALYNSWYADPELRETISAIRRMDREDGRVKKIHSRTARALTKSGLKLDLPSGNKRILSLWDRYLNDCEFNNQMKLESDARGLLLEGNLVMQWILNAERSDLLRAIRMPAESIRPNTSTNGEFINPQAAYEQWDLLTGDKNATFALYQMSIGRLSPDNYDDKGAMGRPYLDAVRIKWQQLIMTEEDTVIRRRERAPQKLAHFLPGATEEELETYERRNQVKSGDIRSNYYSNREGTIQPIEGDANMDQIKDVMLLLDAFFSGAPAPKALFGYTDSINRDILEDLKQDFYDELDSLQDILAWVYREGFIIKLLLNGISPDAHQFKVKFNERLTESMNQRADRAIKIKALGASWHSVMDIAGLDPNAERERKADEDEDFNPYPDDDSSINIKRRVSITEGNATKGESSTAINTNA